MFHFDTLIIILSLLLPLSAQAQNNQQHTSSIVKKKIEALAKSKTPFNKLLIEVRKVLEDEYKTDEVNILVQEFEGRSLQAAKDTVGFPRKSVIFQVGPTMAPVLLGYAPLANEMELQTLQPDGTYEFGVIKHYGPNETDSSKTKYVKPNQAICTGCHQNKAAIFSHFPWSESSNSAGDTGDISALFNRAKEKAENENPVLFDFANEDRFKVVTNNSENGDEKTFDFLNDDTSPFLFDVATRDINNGVQATRICKKVCGENEQCQRLLLAVSVLSFDPDSSGGIRSQIFDVKLDGKKQVLEIVKNTSTENDQLAEMLKKSITNFPDDGFEYVSSVIPDFDIIKQLGEIALSNKSNKKTCGSTNDCKFPNYSESNSINGIGNMMRFSINGLNDLKQKDGRVVPNPLKATTKRPKIAKLSIDEAIERIKSHGAEYCFQLSEGQIESILSSFNTQKELSEFILKDEELIKHIKKAPSSSKGMFAHLTMRDELESKVCVACQIENSLPYLSQSVNSVQQVLDVSLRGGITDEEAIEKMSQYCSGCHANSFAPDLPIDKQNPTESLEALARYISPTSGARLLDRIQTDMPMMNSEQQHAIDKQDDRKILVEKLIEINSRSALTAR